MPHSRNPFFTARNSTPEDLHALLKQRAQSCALSGLGGIGKTQIALEYVYRYASTYQAILWVGAETPETFLSSLTSIAEALELPERLVQDQHKIAQAVIRWLDSHQEWLLVCDNVEDLALPQTLLPSIRQGSLLLTTRLQAEPLLQHALRLGEDALSPESPLRAEVLYRMGALFFFQGKYTETRSFYLQALHIWECTLGSEHPRIGDVLDALASLNQQWCNYTEAELLLQRAQRIKEKALGCEHPHVASNLNDLAGIYIHQRKYEQAALFSQRALRIWRQTLGPEHPSLAFPLSNLADSAAEQGKYEEARDLNEQALRLWEQGM
ncbi:MAG TPA: tetratricopeptide repeat protein [Ktedonobacteraceae bacterium]|nr:tetratricopeptide repeat protein [Ktedonobacteraceae bacterium]